MVICPHNIHDVQKICKDKQYANIKTIGTRHCFNTIADTRNYTDLSTKKGKTVHICTENLKTLHFNEELIKGEEWKVPTITFGSGHTYSTLLKPIDNAGYAIENLPSLPHLNVVGSMITATHGSGHKYQILPNLVVGMDIVFPDGVMKSLHINTTPDFKHYILNFGALGVITSMTIKLLPKYKIFKSIYHDLKWDVLFDKKNFHDIMHRQDYLSFFTNWSDRAMNSVWVGQRFVDGKCPEKLDVFWGAKHITTNNTHPVPGRDASPCITTGVGTWIDKIIHFLPDRPPSSAGDEI